MDNQTVLLIIVLTGLILMSAFFSATETAFSTLNKIRLKTMVSNGDKKAKRVLELEEDYDTLLSTILIGNNIVNIGAASLATLIFVQYYDEAGVTISTIVMTILVLIFGEISPKSLAKEAPESFAMFATPFVKLLTYLFAPLNHFFALWKKMLSKLVKIKNTRGITEEELITMVEEATSDGEIEQHEGDLIRNAIEFNDLDVSDVFTPRMELVAVSEEDSVELIHQLFTESGYSRLPVYRNSIDTIIGVIHLKDFFLRKSNNPKHFIKPVYHTTDSIKISKLLHQLQEQKSHLAVVSDEYGGTVGIVTLEDIVEELVGEIWDEHDEVVMDIEEVESNVYLVFGRASLDKLFRTVDVDYETDIATVNGWVTRQLGHWPQKGDRFYFQNLEVEVCLVEALKAIQVRVTVLQFDEDGSSGE